MSVGKILTIDQIINSTEFDWKNWCNELLDFLKDDGKELQHDIIDSYVHAWTDCFNFLKEYLPRNPEVRRFPLLFEYILPLRNGRRTDVIILLDNKVVVLEFKSTIDYKEEEMIQTNGYVHFIKTSHEVSINNHMEVEGYLVRTRDHGIEHECKIGVILDRDNFTKAMSDSLAGHVEYPDVDEWVNSDTSSIPSIMEAINSLFENGTKIEIRYLKDGDLGKSLPFINEIINKEQLSGGKAVIIVDGVPGSGKTYLGTQVSFDRKEATPPSVYTSGNAPLINYMQTIISPKGSANIQDDCPFVVGINSIKRRYIKEKARAKYGVIVFDESQRAWDEEKMGTGYSEIEGLLQLGDRTQKELGSFVLIALFGSGQAIHEGEEKGLDLWNKAIENHRDYNYYVSDKLGEELSDIGGISTHRELHLSSSIRNNYIDITPWIDALIDNKTIEECQSHLIAAKKKGFEIRIIRDISKWPEYMRIKYPNINRGLLVSSFVNKMDLNTATFGLVSSSYMEPDVAGKWFTGGSNLMNSAATEFVCQGLELDWPFVLFGGDFYRFEGRWRSVIPEDKKRKFENAELIQKNIYRVLLSRGRKGLFLVVPNYIKFDETYQFFNAMGVNDANI